MKTDDCFVLGYVIKPHGLKGEIDIFLDTDNPEDYRELESIFIEMNERLVPFFIKSFKLHPTAAKATLQLEGVESLDQAANLKGSNIHVPESVLPDLDEDSFYYHEVTGFKVVDESEGEIGKVKSFLTYSSTDLMEISHQGRDILVPVNREFIKRVDRENAILHVNLPAGLLNI